MMSVVLLILMFGSLMIGHQFLNAATDIAIEQQTNVWTASRREFGIAALCYVLALLFGLTAMTVSAHAAVPHPDAPRLPVQIIDIQDSPGGNVKEFYDHFAELSKQGAIIRLHGYCASACTLILLREFTGIKACAADPDAIFAFHKPFAFDKRHKVLTTKAGIRIARQMWAAMLAAMPYDAWNLMKDARIPSAAEGDPPNDLFVVPVIFFVPRCAS